MPTVSEVQEREKKTKNILVFGMSETNSSNPEQRNRTELEKLTRLIRPIDTYITLDNTKFYRLGKFSRESTRPVKFILQSQDDALKKTNSKDKNVYIKLDQTELRRSY